MNTQPANDILQLMETMHYDEILNCMRCGFCLPACPTYRETGKETASPRGRIAMMKAVVNGQLDISEKFDSDMYLCLGCRACETACPAGVPYGKLIEGAREVVETYRKRPIFIRLVHNLTMQRLFPYPNRMQKLGSLLYFYQKSGLATLARKSGIMKLLPRSMAEMEKAVPQAASPAERKARQRFVPAKGEKRMTVGLFTGCVMDVMFFNTNEATAKLLSAFGCDVVYIEGQTCCGALHAHAGDKEAAKQLAKQNIEAFEGSGVEGLVNNAGGCGAALKEYHHWFQGDPEWEPRARRFVEAQRDVNELLATLPLPKMRPLPCRVTYQDSCHLAHGQKVRWQPRELLKSIPGIEYVELPEADRCCGSAGIYNITNFDMSMRILDGKMQQVKETKADLVVTSNPGCLLQMRAGIVRAGLQDRMRAVHIADLLYEAVAEPAP
ncbi:(Fe-S)-binding protein [Effusibacillus pohliae]|uniref:(Fe-S)-binding protein n=1 Tax=Effusibacillus pohliae TaxID=232270 RepID=UPI000378971D|nr:(Fe-S)-binding protein [Effusibacillus pohliae]